jgi:hypothetical protein
VALSAALLTIGVAVESRYVLASMFTDEVLSRLPPIVTRYM